ncbi:MAG: CotH kinase family protein [Bacteroidetes bacterium]|nr:CotH kinase family protein [Bacteroidota bacterium]
MRFKHIFFIFSILIFKVVNISAQNFSSSNLPIVIINTGNYNNSTDKYEILDEPKIIASMVIIYRPDSARNNLSDSSNTNYINYKGKISIEIRGSSSQVLPKKSYGLTTLKSDNVTNNNVSILGMPPENDWILNSLAFDSSLIRDYFSYEISRSIGNYSPRGVYCELFLNGNYQGLYIFMEKIKINDERVNIKKLTTSDNSLPNLSGGYIIKADKTGSDPIAWVMNNIYGQGVGFINDNPNPILITTEQKKYISSVFDDLAKSTFSESIYNGYPTVIDIPSFVDFMLINEITSNVDAYQYSTYFHKDRGGKLRAGPIWDFNLTYGNDLFFWNLNRSFTDVWQFDNGDNVGPKFWKELFVNPTFKCYLEKRWLELTKENQPLNSNVLNKKLDAIVLKIAEARERETIRWGRTKDQTIEIAKIKQWISNRIAWMTFKLASNQTCFITTMPNLVISKIHYNPTADNNELLEFIELTNNSKEIVNLTGYYFKDLGYQFQFPSGSKMGPNQKIYIARDSLSFKKAYGINAFGQSSTSLSNKKQNLVLADAFGNVIDQVEYASTAPWPSSANGSGNYLALKSLDLDNSQASNWTTLNASLDADNNGVVDFVNDEFIKLSPNPFFNQLNFDFFLKGYTMLNLDVFDVATGSKVFNQQNIGVGTQLQFNQLTIGTYIFRVLSSDKVVVRQFKMIKL